MTSRDSEAPGPPRELRRAAAHSASPPRLEYVTEYRTGPWSRTRVALLRGVGRKARTRRGWDRARRRPRAGDLAGREGEQPPAEGAGGADPEPDLAAPRGCSATTRGPPPPGERDPARRAQGPAPPARGAARPSGGREHLDGVVRAVPRRDAGDAARLARHGQAGRVRRRRHEGQPRVRGDVPAKDPGDVPQLRRPVGPGLQRREARRRAEHAVLRQGRQAAIRAPGPVFPAGGPRRRHPPLRDAMTEVRQARDADEIRAALALRHEV